MPQSVMEMICQSMTLFLDAPKETMAAEVIWLGRMVWPRRLTQATPYLSNFLRSRSLRGECGLGSFRLVTLVRTSCALSTTMIMECVADDCGEDCDDEVDAGEDADDGAKVGLDEGDC